MFSNKFIGACFIQFSEFENQTLRKWFPIIGEGKYECEIELELRIIHKTVQNSVFARPVVLKHSYLPASHPLIVYAIYDYNPAPPTDEILMDINNQPLERDFTDIVLKTGNAYLLRQDDYPWEQWCSVLPLQLAENSEITAYFSEKGGPTDDLFYLAFPTTLTTTSFLSGGGFAPNNYFDPERMSAARNSILNNQDLFAQAVAVLSAPPSTPEVHAQTQQTQQGGGSHSYIGESQPLVVFALYDYEPPSLDPNEQLLDSNDQPLEAGFTDLALKADSAYLLERADYPWADWCTLVPLQYATDVELDAYYAEKNDPSDPLLFLSPSDNTASPSPSPSSLFSSPFSLQPPPPPPPPPSYIHGFAPENYLSPERVAAARRSLLANPRFAAQTLAALANLNSPQPQPAQQQLIVANPFNPFGTVQATADTLLPEPPQRRPSFAGVSADTSLTTTATVASSSSSSAAAAVDISLQRPSFAGASADSSLTGTVVSVTAAVDGSTLRRPSLDGAPHTAAVSVSAFPSASASASVSRLGQAQTNNKKNRAKTAKPTTLPPRTSVRIDLSSSSSVVGPQQKLSPSSPSSSSSSSSSSSTPSSSSSSSPTVSLPAVTLTKSPQTSSSCPSPSPPLSVSTAVGAAAKLKAVQQPYLSSSSPSSSSSTLSIAAKFKSRQEQPSPSLPPRVSTRINTSPFIPHKPKRGFILDTHPLVLHVSYEYEPSNECPSVDCLGQPLEKGFTELAVEDDEPCLLLRMGHPWKNWVCVVPLQCTNSSGTGHGTTTTEKLLCLKDTKDGNKSDGLDTLGGFVPVANFIGCASKAGEYLLSNPGSAAQTLAILKGK